MSISDHLSGRLRSYELIGIEDLTEPVGVWPCGHCDSWHVEVYRRANSKLAVREWHQDDCQHLIALLRDDVEETG